MGLIKEYVERATQTETNTLPSPYADPAVVLAAPPLPRRGPTQEAHTVCHDSNSASSPSGSDSLMPHIPISPVLATLVSRRISNLTPARCPAGEIVNRRIVSMPENQSEMMSNVHGRRVVSMPDRVRPELEPSVELFQTAPDDSFGPYGGRHERIRVFRSPSDVPQTPSPPSSPESLLIIAAGTQLPEGFLRRKYSPEPLIEEDEDWLTWANSPPRPIPALHGPLSLPYARCPSGAEGTIIEEPDNVAQMIWGLDPDDQVHNQVRVEGSSSHPDNPQHTPSHGPSQVPPRFQKKKVSATQHFPKLSRTQVSPHTSDTKQNLAHPQRRIHDNKHSLHNQLSSDVEACQDTVTGLPWSEGQSILVDIGIPDNFVNDGDLYPVDANRFLEWQLSRLRQALRTSLTDMDPYTTYPRRLEPVIPTSVVPGLPQSYPRIFVEPRPNEPVGSASTAQSPIEIAQQYRQQLYRQALQKQKTQVQNILPTPPNSSSPQWSSQFSPFLAYCSALSPELVGPADHVDPISSQKHRSSANTSQCHHHVYDRHDANIFDTSTDVSMAKTPQIVPNVNPVPSFRQSSSSSTLAKYIKQLQALSPIANFSPSQSVSSPNVSTPLHSLDEGTGPLRTPYHPTAAPTPPSPESPQMVSRSSYPSMRSIARTAQRRLSSVPEEESASLEFSTSVSPLKVQNQTTTDSILSNHDGAKRHQLHYIKVASVDSTRKPAISDLPELERNLGSPSVASYYETSPVKVRLPAAKDHDIRGQTGEYHEQNKGHQHGHRKKHRYKKLKGPAATNEQTITRGLVG